AADRGLPEHHGPVGCQRPRDHHRCPDRQRQHRRLRHRQPEPGQDQLRREQRGHQPGDPDGDRQQRQHLHLHRHDDRGAHSATAPTRRSSDLPPTAVCQNITVQLDASGHATITAVQLDNGSTDASGIASLSLSQTNFDCTTIGTNTVTLTVTDNNGNISTCTGTVTVVDSVAPTAVCKDITVQLDASGHATITAVQIDNGSSDACGIASLSLDKTSFDVSNVGTNLVTLTVTDNNGNTSTCTATVTVVDTVPPTAVCQNITVQLDASGQDPKTVVQVKN